MDQGLFLYFESEAKSLVQRLKLFIAFYFFRYYNIGVL